MENVSLLALFMASLAISVAIPTKSDRLLCRIDNGTHLSGAKQSVADGQQFDRSIPPVLAANVDDIDTTAGLDATVTDRSLYRTSDPTADRMPRNHSYTVESLDQTKDESLQWHLSADGYKQQPSVVQH